MKKLLALVLALVMTLSLCITSNAAFAGEEYDYDEAVEVMAAVGVFQGDENGKFNGKAELTREQAAKLIAYLDLGEKVAEALPAVKVFNDVEATRWSAKYVAYCADAGYIAGVGDGNFDPNGKLTGYAFGKMLLCALGYDATIEGFTGSNWTIKVAALMQSEKLTKGVDGAASANLTREEAAQYCFNALNTNMVKYTDKGTGITVAGVEIKTGASDAIDDPAKGLLKDYLYNDSEPATGAKGLKKDAADNDSFGRPATSWKLDGDDIGTYASTADYTTVLTKTYTDGADEGEDAKDELIKGIADALDLDLDDYVVDNAEVWFNGASGDEVRAANDGMNRAAAAAAMLEAINNPGVVVELFMNDDDDAVEALVAYNYVLVEVTDVDEYDDESDEVKKYGITEYYALKDLTNDRAIAYDGDEEDSIDGAYVDAKNSKADSDAYNAIGTWEEDDQFVAVVDVLTGAILAKADVKTVDGKKTAAGTAYVKIDGTKYVASATVVGKFGTYDDTYTAYLDPQGSVIFAEVSKEAETTYNYAYLVDSASDFNDADLLTGDKSSAAVKLLYTDGSVEKLNYAVTKATKATTVQTYDTDKTTVAKGDYYFTFEGKKYAATDAVFLAVVTAKEGQWFTYTTDANGCVTLKDADVAEKSVADKDLTLAADSVKVADTIYADSTTKLTVLDTTDGVLKTYTGYKAIREANTTNTFGSQTAGMVLFMTNSAETKATEIFLVKNDYTATETVNAALYVKALEDVDGGTLSQFYVDGKKVEYTVDTNCTNKGTLAQGYVYDIDVTDDKVTSVTKITAVEGTVTAVGDNYVVVDPTGATEDTIYTFTDDGCAVYQVNAEGSAVSSGTLKANQKVLVVLESGKAAQAFIYKTNIAYFTVG